MNYQIGPSSFWNHFNGIHDYLIGGLIIFFLVSLYGICHPRPGSDAEGLKIRPTAFVIILGVMTFAVYIAIGGSL